MDTKKKLIGAALSASVAVAFAAMPGVSSLAVVGYHEVLVVKCYGVNQCSNRSDCRITTNSCKVLNEGRNQNSCKGQGFLYKTVDECRILGGSTPEDPDALK